MGISVWSLQKVYESNDIIDYLCFLLQRVELSLKEDMEKKKIKLSISVESDNNLVKELLINKSFENISIFSRTNKTQFHSHLLCC